MNNMMRLKYQITEDDLENNISIFAIVIHISKITQAEDGLFTLKYPFMDTANVT